MSEAWVFGGAPLGFSLFVMAMLSKTVWKSIVLSAVAGMLIYGPFLFVCIDALWTGRP